MFTIFYYMTLSLYRIHQNSSLKALFVAFAIVNSIYVCKFKDILFTVRLQTINNMLSSLGCTHGLE